MERIIPDNESFIILQEHKHRYEWAKKWAYGSVCDIACGVGYGSFIAIDNKKISTYRGYDLSAEAIDYANLHYANKNISFEQASCYDLSMVLDSSVDTLISLETLEHLDSPQNALSEFARILKQEGILISSVPTATYEKLCTETYGPNPYHLQMFEEDEIRGLIGRYFRYVKIFYASLNISSTIIDGSHELSYKAGKEENIHGSYLILATNSERTFNHVSSTNGNDRLKIASLVDYDLVQIIPKMNAISKQTSMIDERDQLIQKQDEIIANLKQTIDGQANLVNERDQLIIQQDEIIEALKQTIVDQTQLIDDKDLLIRNQDSLIQGRDRTINDQTHLIDERDQAISNMEKIINDQAENKINEIDLLKTQLNLLNHKLLETTKELERKSDAIIAQQKEADIKQKLIHDYELILGSFKHSLYNAVKILFRGNNK